MAQHQDIGVHSESELVISFRHPHIGWRSYALAAGGFLALVFAIVAPIWAYRNLKIPFPPIVGDDMATTKVGESVNISVLTNDGDPVSIIDPATIELKREPQHGQATVNPQTGVVVYTPAAGYLGRDYFMYTVRNREGVESNVGAVKVRITP